MLVPNNEIDKAKEFLRVLSENAGVSGYEYGISNLLPAQFQEIADETYNDRFGNFYAVKHGEVGKYRIMLAAHMDEIGLMVKEIDARGFLRFTSIGGVDARTLLSQEVIIHGRKDVLGVISTVPPHLLHDGEDGKVMKMEEMGIDVGLSEVQIREIIQVGDTISVRRSLHELLNSTVSGKALDDRAGVVALAVCLEELTRLRHAHEVIAVATVQEEVGIRGAITSAYSLNPDLAIAIDVTHASTPDTKGQVNLDLGKGPAIALGPNIHPSIFHHLTEAAKNARLPHQIEPIPGISGTDAWAIQVTQAGIPTGLLSVPLRYMHTSVETLDVEDVIHTGKLMAHFIASLPENLEEFLCY